MYLASLTPQGNVVQKTLHNERQELKMCPQAKSVMAGRSAQHAQAGSAARGGRGAGEQMQA